MRYSRNSCTDFNLEFENGNGWRGKKIQTVMDRDGRLKEEIKLEVMNICHLKKIRSEHLKITPNFGQLQAYLTISASLNKLKMCLLKQT